MATVATYSRLYKSQSKEKERKVVLVSSRSAAQSWGVFRIPAGRVERCLCHSLLHPLTTPLLIVCVYGGMDISGQFLIDKKKCLICKYSIYKRKEE